MIFWIFFLSLIQANIINYLKEGSSILDEEKVLSKEYRWKMDYFLRKPRIQEKMNMHVHFISSLEGQSIDEYTKSHYHQILESPARTTLFVVSLSDRQYYLQTWPESLLTQEQKDFWLYGAKTFLKRKDFDGAVYYLAQQLAGDFINDPQAAPSPPKNLPLPWYWPFAFLGFSLLFPFILSPPFRRRPRLIYSYDSPEASRQLDWEQSKLIQKEVR